MPNPKDACHLLDADHRAVKKMFKEYEELTSSKARDSRARKMDLAREICLQLTVHAQIEDEIFYPALREAIRETDLLDEAEVEHQTARDLIAQIEAMEDSEEIIDAKVKVLGEYIDWKILRPSGDCTIPRSTILCGVSSVMSSSASTTRPIPARTIPQMALSVVVLPAPFPPISVTISPASTVSEMPFNA